jgi:hypothetical protein
MTAAPALTDPFDLASMVNELLTRRTARSSFTTGTRPAGSAPLARPLLFTSALTIGTRADGVGHVPKLNPFYPLIPDSAHRLGSDEVEGIVGRGLSYRSH